MPVIRFDPPRFNEPGDEHAGICAPGADSPGRAEQIRVQPHDTAGPLVAETLAAFASASS